MRLIEETARQFGQLHLGGDTLKPLGTLVYWYGIPSFSHQVTLFVRGDDGRVETEPLVFGGGPQGDWIGLSTERGAVRCPVKSDDHLLAVYILNPLLLSPERRERALELIQRQDHWREHGRAKGLSRFSVSTNMGRLAVRDTAHKDAEPRVADERLELFRDGKHAQDFAQMLEGRWLLGA
jgi:hypothetical protein